MSTGVSDVALDKVHSATRWNSPIILNILTKDVMCIRVELIDTCVVEPSFVVLLTYIDTHDTVKPSHYVAVW